ncbi:MAG: PHP-associated domain-containing protein, partial [Myxococcota bacterium]
IDGFVLTEHRQFDETSDYRALEDRFGLLILKASEVETEYGHVLVFGVNDDLRAAFDFARINNPLAMVLKEAKRCGAVAIPCHPGRPKVGLCAHWESKGPVEGVHSVETLNGGSREGENEQAQEYAERFGWNGIGGSDSHIVSHIGRFATRFEAELHHIEDLVAALQSGRFSAIRLDATSA